MGNEPISFPVIGYLHYFGFHGLILLILSWEVCRWTNHSSGAGDGGKKYWSTILDVTQLCACQRPTWECNVNHDLNVSLAVEMLLLTNYPFSEIVIYWMDPNDLSETIIATTSQYSKSDQLTSSEIVMSRLTTKRPQQINHFLFHNTITHMLNLTRTMWRITLLLLTSKHCTCSQNL